MKPASQKSLAFCVLSFFAFLSTQVESENTRVIESERETCVPQLQVKGLTQPPAPAGTKIQLSYVYNSTYLKSETIQSILVLLALVLM